MITAFILFGALLGACVLISLQDFSVSERQKRKELRRLMRQESARKTWERMIKQDQKH